jgi:sugar lactone lactonase YvrE
LDGALNIYITSRTNYAIRMAAAGTGFLSRFAGSYTVRGNTDGAPMTAALFNLPYGVAADGAGNLFVTDYNAGTVRKVPAGGGNTSTLAGPVPGPGSQNGVLAVATFNSPRGMAFDAAGNLYVADSLNNLIRRIDPTGQVITYAGTTAALPAPAPAGGIVDGVGPNARFNGPRSIVVDPDGILYVSDVFSSTIRRITTDTNVTTVLGTAGTPGYVNGNGVAAQFDKPQGLAMDDLGNLYVADSGNNCVRRVTPGLNVTLLAGVPGTGGTTDGALGVGLLNTPVGLVLDGAGNLIVSDAGGNNIRKIALADGTLSTLAGTPGAGGFVDGAGLAARFRQPTALAMDASGNILVADAGNEAVRMVSPTGVVITAVGIPNLRGVAPGPLPQPFSDPQGIVLDGSGNYYLSTINAIMKVVLQ